MSLTRAESDALYAAGPEAVCAAVQQQDTRRGALGARVAALAVAEHQAATIARPHCRGSTR